MFDARMYEKVSCLSFNTYVDRESWELSCGVCEELRITDFDNLIFVGSL